MLYTCNIYPCAQQAQIMKTNLAAIGLKVRVIPWDVSTMFARDATPGAPFDIAWYGWIANYPDPAGMLPFMLNDSAFYPTFNDPTSQRHLTETGQLTGPNRYTAYGKLDLDLARNAAPLIAYGSTLAADFFSARIGCQTYTGVYVGMDIAALCIKARTNAAG